MRIWAVFISYLGGAGEYIGQWIDTEWADEAHATERCTMLKETIRAFHVGRHEVKVVEMKVQDAAVARKHCKKENDDGRCN
jgi:hypothetical protein